LTWFLPPLNIKRLGDAFFHVGWVVEGVIVLLNFSSLGEEADDGNRAAWKPDPADGDKAKCWGTNQLWALGCPPIRDIQF